MQLSHTKRKAIWYRKRGYSYNMISEKLFLPKSTLSYWLKEIPYKPNKKTIKRIGEGKLKSAQKKNQKRIENINEMRRIASQEIGKLTKRDLFMIGVGLYWGDGTKNNEHIRLINSDPDVIRLAIKWFKSVCGVKDENLTISIHIYPDNDKKECLEYWSKITGISLNNFHKIQIDKRVKSSKKKGKLSYGTAHLYVRTKGKKEFGVELHRKIMGWIEAVTRQT